MHLIREMASNAQEIRAICNDMVHGTRPGQLPSSSSMVRLAQAGEQQACLYNELTTFIDGIVAAAVMGR